MFCIDNFENKGNVFEVILNNAFSCIDEDEEGINFAELILKIAAPTSLVCLILTSLVYIVLPTPEKKAEKAKIILINVIFTALFCALYLVFKLTNPTTWQLTCSNIICRFCRCFMVFFTNVLVVLILHLTA